MNLSLFLPDLGFGLVTASILALGAVGFTLLYGVTGVVDFAYGDQMTVTAYVIWWLNTSFHLSIWFAALVGILFMGVFSVLMGRVLIAPFKTRHAGLFALLIVTFGFGLILQNVVQLFAGPGFQAYRIPQAQTIGFLGMVFTNQDLLVFAGAIVSMLVIHTLLQYTRVGIGMRAIADNGSLARTCGINIVRLTDLTWLIAGLLAGIAGFALTLNTTAFGPTVGATFLLIIVAASVLGGVGRPYGAMLGALVVGVATEISVLVLPASDKTAVALVVLILVLLIRPQGIIAAVGRS